MFLHGQRPWRKSYDFNLSQYFSSDVYFFLISTTCAEIHQFHCGSLVLPKSSYIDIYITQKGVKISLLLSLCCIACCCLRALFNYASLVPDCVRERRTHPNLTAIVGCFLLRWINHSVPSRTWNVEAEGRESLIILDDFSPNVSVVVLKASSYYLRQLLSTKLQLSSLVAIM